MSGVRVRTYSSLKKYARVYILLWFLIALAIVIVFRQQYRAVKNYFFKLDYRPIHKPNPTDRQQFRTNSELRKYEQALYSVVPEAFHPDFKAPCWYTPERHELMCLPYFYIAGFPKCGTTDLWFQVVKHPDIVRVCKEPHWWAWRHYGVQAPTCGEEVSKASIASGKNYSSIDWYLHFYRIQGTFSEIAKRNVSSSSFHPKVFGDASISTSYGTVGSFFSKYELHNELFAANIPELLHSVTPNAKIIFILRDPVDRFYSAYQYSPFGRRNGTPDDFHKQTMNAIKCFQACLESHSLYYCGHHLELCKRHSHGHVDKLPLGMYSIFISDWLKAFPRKQLYFLTLTEWESNAGTTLAEIFRFLELPPTGRITFDDKKPKNSRRYKDMLPKTRQLLRAFYQPFNTKLVQLLNDEKFAFSSLNGLT